MDIGLCCVGTSRLNLLIPNEQLTALDIVAPFIHSDQIKIQYFIFFLKCHQKISEIAKKRLKMSQFEINPKKYLATR